MVHANRTENIETGSSGHLQVENDGIRICFLYAANGFRHIARLPYKLRSRYFLQQVRQSSTTALESSAIKTLIWTLLGNEPPAWYRE